MKYIKHCKYMERLKYYNLREYVAMQNITIKYMNEINENYRGYPHLRKLTLEELKEWFINRDVEIENEIRKILEVE